MNDTNLVISRAKDYFYIIAVSISLLSLVFAFGGFYWKTESQFVAMEKMQEDIKLIKENLYVLNERNNEKFSNIEKLIVSLQKDIDFLSHAAR